MKNKKSILVMALIMVFVLASVVVYAAPDMSGVGKNEVVEDDYYGAGQEIKNEGTVKGDFIVAGKEISNYAVVEGDFIGAASEISLEGNVQGDARCAAGNVDVRGIVGKNVNVFAGNINVGEGAEIGRNLLAAGGIVDVDGKIGGTTKIYGDKVILRGEFMGDVLVSRGNDGDASSSELVVEKGTVINGKLTYKGVNEAKIQDGASIKDFEWIKLQVANKAVEKRGSTDYLWQFIKLILTGLLYFLIGLMAYKLLPEYFERQGRYISDKPLNIVGAGLIALIAILASIIVFVVLMLLSIALISPSIGLVFACAATLIYVLLFYFSSIPVSLWLGNLILRGDNYSVVKKFAAGLAAVTIGFFILDMLSKISTVGAIFSIISFILGFAAVVFGIGALLYTVGDLIKNARSSSFVD